MNYRNVESYDLEKITDLFDAYRVFYRKESDKESAKNFLEERINQKDSEIFVAENQEGNLVGFVQLYPIFSSTRMQKLWLLNDLFVNPEFRGKGISKGLIETSKELAKDSGACGLLLETEKSNIIGNSLYPRTGFVLNEASNFYEWNI
ncbi:GNAT family N-acetyltransferase [Aureivirga sp. CE67]|uniref:GNAT family N-acetyltransferase n=1 Tax=Aureivirga sp. CE67 TaxID=1788983 RepID=UPI0018CB34D1|nr:GNAT family N-acetyltransferase [Aureivirga sp. CE67]